MPYFVFKVSPERKLERLEAFAGYRDARQYARDQRALLAADDPHKIRMVHAENVMEAERLLSAPREVQVYGDD